MTVIVSASAPTLSATSITAVWPARSDDAGLLELLEALQLRGHAIRAERQQRRAIEAALVGDDDALIAGVDVGDGDGDAGQHARPGRP